MCKNGVSVRMSCVTRALLSIIFTGSWTILSRLLITVIFNYFWKEFGFLKQKKSLYIFSKNFQTRIQIFWRKWLQEWLDLIILSPKKNYPAYYMLFIIYEFSKTCVFSTDFKELYGCDEKEIVCGTIFFFSFIWLVLTILELILSRKLEFVSGSFLKKCTSSFES